jgi:hypothetical protein
VPGKQYFVVNYTPESNTATKPSFFIDKIIVQPRDEKIPPSIKARVQKAVPRQFKFEKSEFSSFRHDTAEVLTKCLKYDAK